MGGCVVCLVGLPGSGKTTLAHSIALTLTPEHSVNLITFDREIPWSEDINWKRERQALAERVSILLRNGSTEIVILDDNMYYRSMRKEYWSLARSCLAGFCQMYLKVRLETAMTRNASRRDPIPERVIREMALKIQPPQPSKNNWESRSLMVDVNNRIPDIGPIVSFILEALANPRDPETLYPKEEPPPSSATHSADLILRRIVGDWIRKSDHSIQLVAALNNRRKYILDQIRSGTISLPSSEGDTHHSYYAFLETFFSDIPQ